MEIRKMIGLALLLCTTCLFIINQDSNVDFLGLSSDFWTGFVLAVSVTVPITMFVHHLISRFFSRNNQAVEASSTLKKSTSVGDGYWFFFEHEGDEIVLHRSTYMGVETVYLNDNPVSKKNNLLGVRKSHEFIHKSKKIRVVTDFVNIIGYRYECSLYVGLIKYHSETKGLVVANGHDFAKSVAITLCIGLAAGLISGGMFYLIAHLFSQF